MLGFFTRELGGIHGILYVQDILVERMLPGMEEAADFLHELGSRSVRPRITFITTKWDLVESAPKLLRKCENREAELKNVTWASFNIGEPGGSTYFRHGIDCVEDSQEAQEEGRGLLISNVKAQYRNATTQSLRMPFSEWTHMEQGFKVVTVTGQILVVGLGVGMVALTCFLIAAGHPVTIAFSVGLIL